MQEESSDQNQTPVVQTATFFSLGVEADIVETLRKAGIQTPTPVQAQVIPLALAGKDVVAQAKTGSGKTLAFVLPLLMRLSAANPPANKTSALIIAPTRELATQITGVISTLDTGLRPVCLIGGVAVTQQLAGLRADCRIVVGTPGRILDLLRQREISLRLCQYFVVDEVDQMFSMDFIEDVRAILARLPEKRQGVFVSATVTPRVESLANSFLNKPEKVVINAPGEELPPVDHYYMQISGEVTAKAAALCDLLESERPASAIIFCNTKSDTELVEVFLRRRGFDARRINSDLTQKQRDLIMRQIRSREIQFLVATDIAARGLDIEQLEMVINYAIPEDAESYVHRTGRTGRAGRSGRAVSLIGPQDFASFVNLKRSGGPSLKTLTIPGESELIAARLAHLYEIVRQAKVEITDRELLMARRLLKELGGIEDANEELAELIAKLCHYTTEHIVTAQQPAANGVTTSAAASQEPVLEESPVNEKSETEEESAPARHHREERPRRSFDRRSHHGDSRGRGDRRPPRRGGRR